MFHNCFAFGCVLILYSKRYYNIFIVWSDLCFMAKSGKELCVYCVCVCCLFVCGALCCVQNQHFENLCVRVVELSVPDAFV